MPGQTIGASFGDALLAGIGVGLLPADTDWTVIARTIEPDPQHAAMYDARYATWRELYPATRAQIHRLASPT